MSVHAIKAALEENIESEACHKKYDNFMRENKKDAVSEHMTFTVLKGYVNRKRRRTFLMHSYMHVMQTAEKIPR